MSFLRHLRRSVWELAFSALASACVGVCLSEGFRIPPELEGRFFPALLVCLVLNILAYGFSYSKKTAAAGVGALVLAVGCAALELRRGAGETSLYAVVVCCACIAVFFLSRTRIGALLALPLGVLVITGEMLFQYGSHPALLILFLLSSSCLALSRIYRGNMLGSSTRRAAFSAHALVSIAACALALLLAVGAYFAVVKPLSPPSYEVLLRTELQRLPLLEKLGVATTISLPDPDKRTDEVFDSDLLADLSGEQKEAPLPSEAPKEDGGDAGPESSQSPVAADAIRYLSRSRTWLCAAALAALAVLAAILGRLALRHRRLSRILNMSARNQVTALYPTILSAMEQCGLPPLNAASPMEYCESFGDGIQQFLGDNFDFAELTRVFEHAFYGGLTPDEEERTQYIELCRRLPSLCRKRVGLLRYAAVFFRV